MMTTAQYLRQIENYDNRIKNKLVVLVAFVVLVAESVPVRMALPADNYSVIVLIYLDTAVFVEMVAQNTDYHTAYLKPPLFL